MATAATTGKAKTTKPKLTKTQAVAELKRWRKEHDGRVPSSADFWPARLLQYSAAASKKGEKEKAQEFKRQAQEHVEDGYPITPQVTKHFGGSWVKALMAAGLKPKRVPKKSS